MGKATTNSLRLRSQAVPEYVNDIDRASLSLTEWTGPYHSYELYLVTNWWKGKCHCKQILSLNNYINKIKLRLKGGRDIEHASYYMFGTDGCSIDQPSLGKLRHMDNERQH